MTKQLSRLQLAQNRAEAVAKETNEKINELGGHTDSLYTLLSKIQLLFDRIRHVPDETRLKYEEIKAISLNWEQQVSQIQIEYKKAELKTAGSGVIGVGTGVAGAAMGPTVAMGIATTIGTASTGTAISSLSGVAATNAAMAWLGGGTLAAGGGGMAAGNFLLVLTGPIGISIAAVSLTASGLVLFKQKTDKAKLEDVYTLISHREIKSFELAIVELNERITRIAEESEQLTAAVKRIEGFGPEYTFMTEAQQYELGTYLNLMLSATQLLVNPIVGLQPNYSAGDFDEFCEDEQNADSDYVKGHRPMIMALANLLYKIELDEKDKKLLLHTLRLNKEFLTTIQMSKKDFDLQSIVTVERALKHAYSRKKEPNTKS